MDNLLLAAACLLAGLALRLSGRLPHEGDRALAGVVIHVSAPAVAFLAARAMPLTPEVLLPGSMAWVVFAGGALFFGLAAKLMGLSRQTFGCLMLTGGLCNTIFIGLPMTEAFFGHEYSYIPFLCDNPGTSLVLALPGVMLASHLSGAAKGGLGQRLRQSLWRVVSFPPFVGMALGLALRPVAPPDWVLSAISRVGGTTVPLSLLAVGMGIRLRAPGKAWKPLALGLGYKLALAPALMWLVAAGLWRNTGPVAQVTVFGAAMPPMILGAILATDHGLDPDLAGLLVAAGTALSFLTLPLWRLALNWM